MTYRVLYKRFFDTTKNFMLVEDTIEADNFQVVEGCLIFNRTVQVPETKDCGAYEIKQNIVAIPPGFWFPPVEPVSAQSLVIPTVTP